LFQILENGQRLFRNYSLKPVTCNDSWKDLLFFSSSSHPLLLLLLLLPPSSTESQSPSLLTAQQRGRFIDGCTFDDVRSVG
jgi:hypothetical protein